MEEEVKAKLDILEKQIDTVHENLKSSIDVVKWYVSGVVGVVAIIFAALGVVFTINYNTDRGTFNAQIGRGLDELKKFQDDTKEYIKEKIGTSEDAKIELRSALNKLPLDDQEIILYITTETDASNQPFWRNRIGFIIKNTGNAQSGPLYFKIYMPLNTGDKSADEEKYGYEYSINPDEINPNVIPGGYTSTFHVTVDLYPKLVGTELKSGKYPSLIKVYYGKGKVTSAPVFLVIERAPPLPAPDSAPSPSNPPAPPTR
jgi:hypothetical protein